MAKVKSSMTTKELKAYLTSAKQSKQRISLPKKTNKLGNSWSEYNGVKFQSKLERDRYIELLTLLRAKVIRDLELQPKFVLQDSYKVCKNGKVHTIRAITYSGDFKYVLNGKVIVEDAKGHLTDGYKRAKKLALQVMFKAGIDEFREVFDAEAKRINIYKRL